MFFTPFFQVVLFHGLLVFAQSSFQLGYIPLAIKNPYLHGWIVSNKGGSPEGAWPNFFTTSREFGWAGMIRVDNQAFQWMGNSGFNFTKTLTSEITPTTSIFRIEAGPIQFNVTFLSPIEPNNYTLQSIPFTYMYIDGFTSSDALPHTVQVYSDISAQWVSSDDTAPVKWDTDDLDDMVSHHVQRQNPLSMPVVDNGDMPEDGVGYYATAKRSGLTWQTAADVVCRHTFANNGTLANSKDTAFRAVANNWPVFAFSVDLGTIASGNQPDPVVWTLGLVRDPLVTYATNSSVENRSAYYWSAYQSINEVISTFLKGFASARTRSQALDDKVLTAASAISQEYTGILSLVTRQVFASMAITIPTTQKGKPSPSDVKIFMKDIGMSLRANPVEVIYGAFPALLYFNSSFAHDLLQPLLDFQSSSKYDHPYAAPDLGDTYPVILGNTTDTQRLAVESCGNMLIMVYAYAVKSGDGSLLSRYYPTLQLWADFLVQNSLHPQGFISADGLGNPDMSNLALKGILGIYSMGKINEAVNPSNTTFRDQATDLIANWKQLAGADSHIQAAYGRPSSWALMYNLFPAIWLDTGLIEDDILTRQAQFYGQQSTAPDLSLSLDSTQPDVAYPHWSLMTAATIPSGLNSIRDQLIRTTYHQAYNVTNKFPLPVKYKASTGERLSGTTGSAIQGAAFAILAMSLKNVGINSNPMDSPDSDPGSKKVNVGAIVGGVIGGLAFVLIVAGAIFFFWRKRKQQQEAVASDPIDDEYSKPRPFTGGPTNYAKVNNDSTPQLPNTFVLTQWTPDWDGVSQPQGSETETSSGSPISPPPGAAGAVPLSSKQREALGRNQSAHTHQSALSVSALSTLSNPYSGSEHLRAEVEQLRREMENIRNMAEPPPGYH